jgi:hypothetical protein
MEETETMDMAVAETTETAAAAMTEMTATDDGNDGDGYGSRRDAGL